MPDLPAASDVVNVLRYVVAPAVGGAAVAAGVLGGLGWGAARALKFNWRGLAPAIGPVAVLAGLLAGDYVRPALPTGSAGGPWHWGWAVVLVIVVEAVARLPGVSVATGNLLRGTAAGLAAAVVVPTQAQAEVRWLVPAFALATAVQWAVVDAAGRRSPGGAVAAAVAVAALGAAAVLLYGQSPAFADVATFLFAAVATLAGLAWLTGADAGSAAASAVTPLAILLVLGRTAHDSAVPNVSFALAGFAPTLLGLFLFPGLARLNNSWAGAVLKVVVVAAPVAWAVYRAMQAAPVSFDGGNRY